MAGLVVTAGPAVTSVPHCFPLHSRYVKIYEEVARVAGDQLSTTVADYRRTCDWLSDS